MRKATLSVILGMILSQVSNGQTPGIDEVLENLIKLEDQFGDNFNSNNFNDTLRLICVEGVNTSYQEIYSKFKGKQTLPGTQVVAGWKNVMPGATPEEKKDHMSGGIAAEGGLGKNSYSLLMDFNSEIVDLLKLNRYSIVTVIKKEDKIEIRDFGSDRIQFINEIRKYFK